MPTSASGLRRLAAELRADIAAADGKALHLAPWATRVAVDDEVYIPAVASWPSVKASLERAAAHLDACAVALA